MGKYKFRDLPSVICSTLPNILWSTQLGELDDTIYVIANINMEEITKETMTYLILGTIAYNSKKTDDDNYVEIRNIAYSIRGELLKNKKSLVVHLNNLDTLIEDSKNIKNMCIDILPNKSLCGA